MSSRRAALWLVGSLIAAPAASGAAPFADRPEVRGFVGAMAREHGFAAERLLALFARAEPQQSIIDAITRPAESKPWHAYRDIFLVPRRIGGGVSFWREHEQTLARAQAVHGVPPEIVVAILGVETLYGRNTGRYRVLEALGTLAFDYPRRADFFRRELEQYLLLTREEGIDPLSLKGSYAGAMGIAQFIPSSYRAYAVDFDGDRRRDLWTNPADAIGSVANYLSVHRWQAGAPVAAPARAVGDGYREVLSKDLQPRLTVGELARHGATPWSYFDPQRPAALLELEGEHGPELWMGFDNFYVITRYNRSALYAMAVHQLAEAIRRQRDGG